MVGNVACYVHILHADLTLGLEVDLGGQLNPDWSACSGPAGGCKARLPGLYVIPGYRLTYEWVSTRPSSSTCYFGAAKAGQSSRRRFRPYECSSSAVSGPFSRSTSCTRSLGPKSWSCAKFRTSSRPWTTAGPAGSRNCRRVDDGLRSTRLNSEFII